MKKSLFVLILPLLVISFRNTVLAKEHEVKVFYGHSFVPKKLTINKGDSVKWVWISSGHTVTSGKGKPNGIFATNGELNQGDTFKIKFTKKFIKKNPVSKNRYRYYCVPHYQSGMTGIVKVRD